VAASVHRSPHTPHAIPRGHRSAAAPARARAPAPRLAPPAPGSASPGGTRAPPPRRRPGPDRTAAGTAPTAPSPPPRLPHPRRVQCRDHPRRVAPPVLPLHAELRPALPGQRVVLRPPAVLRRAPARLHPTPLLQPVQGRVQRPLPHRQRVAGRGLDP